jgi:hypothetical protein
MFSPVRVAKGFAIRLLARQPNSFDRSKLQADSQTALFFCISGRQDKGESPLHRRPKMTLFQSRMGIFLLA